MRKTPFTIKDFMENYGSEDQCLDKLFKQKYSDLEECPHCFKKFAYYRVKKRKCYACQYCGYQLHPLANTIFYKSKTPLKLWLYAIYLFSTSRNGVSAMELQRQLGVTYKTAWRMAKQIRLLFKDIQAPLGGTVEVDETYVGGKAKNARGRSLKKKTPVVGIVERKGYVKAQVTVDTKRNTLESFIQKNVTNEVRIMTDDYPSYKGLKQKYEHQVINHSQHKYVYGEIHTNTIEGFWSQLKRSLDGTHHHVSPKYLQQYVNEYVFRYNQRDSTRNLFSTLIKKI